LKQEICLLDYRWSILIDDEDLSMFVHGSSIKNVTGMGLGTFGKVWNKTVFTRVFINITPVTSAAAIGSVNSVFVLTTAPNG